MGTEKLKFKLELDSTHWDKPPIAEILIGDKSHFKQEITKPTIIEFEHTCEENKEYSLTILRSGKNNNQTVLKDDKII